MHDFETLAADLTPFFQKRGDSGGTGDSSSNHLNVYDFSVTTRRNRLSPVDLRVVTSAKSSGDPENERSQSFNKSVTTGTSVTTSFEQGPASALPADSPLEWQAICDELKRSEPPTWASAERWRELVADAEGFLAVWGKAADQLGWTTLDLFGVHPTAPAARFDVMGLILILRGRKVSALAEQTATIDCNSGAKLTFFPRTGAGAVLMTEASATCASIAENRLEPAAADQMCYTFRSDSAAIQRR
jgi:hypothetical protein